MHYYDYMGFAGLAIAVIGVAIVMLLGVSNKYLYSEWPVRAALILGGIGCCLLMAAAILQPEPLALLQALPS